MENSNLVINQNCMQCGSCLGYGYSFLSSDSDGSPIVKAGTVLKEDSVEYQNLKEICPVEAFELIKEIDNNEVINSLVQALRNFQGVKIPANDDVKFISEEYNIPIPVASGEYKYEYKSTEAAERAGYREFDRIMYSQLDNLILKVITEYRIRKVKPYYTDQIEEGSVYAESNQKLSKILEGIKDILGDKIPEDYAEVGIFPSDETIWKMLNKGELVSNELVSDVRSEFDSMNYTYDYLIESDEMERCVGTDWRGNNKWDDRACYKNVRNVCQELAKDILSSCGYAADKMEECAVGHIKWLVEKYNLKIREIINEKYKIIQPFLKDIKGDSNKQIDTIDNGMIRKESDKILYNEKEAVFEKELPLTYYDKIQFSYEDGQIYKMFYSNGLLQKELMWPEQQFDYYKIWGHQGILVFLDGREDNLYNYDCRNDKLTKLEEHVANLIMFEDKLIYVKFTHNNVYSFGGKEIWYSTKDGQKKCMVASYPTGYQGTGTFNLIMRLRIEGNRLKYVYKQYNNYKIQEETEKEMRIEDLNKMMEGGNSPLFWLRQH